MAAAPFFYSLKVSSLYIEGWSLPLVLCSVQEEELWRRVAWLQEFGVLYGDLQEACPWTWHVWGSYCCWLAGWRLEHMAGVEARRGRDGATQLACVLGDHGQEGSTSVIAGICIGKSRVRGYWSAWGFVVRIGEAWKETWEGFFQLGWCDLEKQK